MTSFSRSRSRQETVRKGSAVLRKNAKRAWFRSCELFQEHLHQGREYAILLPFGHRVYQPWFGQDRESDFGQDLATMYAAGKATMSVDRYYTLYQLARSAPADGDWAECGVFSGSSAHLLALARERDSRESTLHLFDSFEGMPSYTVADRDNHRPGEFGPSSDLAQVRRRLSPFRDVTFHVGFIPDTFAEVEDVGPYGFVHVDVDIYPTSRDCCQWFWPRMTTGGLMVFDDYGFKGYKRAIRAAVDEFFDEERVPVLAMPTGQAVVIKR